MLIGMYCGLSTASEVFLIFTTQLYHYLSVCFLFALFNDKPEVFLPKYSQTATLQGSKTYILIAVIDGSGGGGWEWRQTGKVS